MGLAQPPALPTPTPAPSLTWVPYLRLSRRCYGAAPVVTSRSPPRRCAAWRRAPGQVSCCYAIPFSPAPSRCCGSVARSRIVHAPALCCASPRSHRVCPGKPIEYVWLRLIQWAQYLAHTPDLQLSALAVADPLPAKRVPWPGTPALAPPTPVRSLRSTVARPAAGCARASPGTALQASRTLSPRPAARPPRCWDPACRHLHDRGTGPGAVLLAPAKPGQGVQGESTGSSAQALAERPDATAWPGAAAAAPTANRETSALPAAYGTRQGGRPGGRQAASAGAPAGPASPLMEGDGGAAGLNLGGGIH